MEELDEYNSIINGDDLEILEQLRSRLEYFFMDPLKKWRHKNTRPWKLLVQILKVIIFTSQLVIFGSDMAQFINYKEEMQVTLKQLFLKDWDPSADAIAYPGPYIPYAAYTKDDFIHSVNYPIRVYSNITNLSLGPLGYTSDNVRKVPKIELCITDYTQAYFDPTTFSYNYSTNSITSCYSISEVAPAGDHRWQQLDFRTYMEKPLNFSSLTSLCLNFPLRTILIEDATTGDPQVVCFEFDVKIFYDNRHRNGQVVTSLSSNFRQSKCHGQLKEQLTSKINSRRMLNTMILVSCAISFGLCMRSLWRSIQLMNTTNGILKLHERRLGWSDKFEFIDGWLMLIILNDLMVAYATVIMTFYDNQLLETDNYTTCSLLLGLGNFLSWSGLLRYLSFFKKYNLLIVTLRKSFVHVIRFMLCTTIIYCGFCFCGWIVFGPYHFKFRELSTTTECLFALINGDDMFETFALLRSNIGPVWWFSRIYLYLFVSLFIYVVLSLFIALIMDAYELIKQYSVDGFPKSRLEHFYADGDMSKLRRLL